jgi:uncharacterized protein (DUF2252 family)
MRDPIDEFMRFNRPFALRNRELLRLKVARMAESPFAFFRGSFHLFARDVLDKVCEPVGLPASTAGELDLVGDLHCDNFGTYQADDGAVHYDINDFDETTQGRFDFDVSRLSTSFFLASRERGDNLQDAVLVCLAFLDAYVEVVHRFLKKGKDPELDVSERAPSGCSSVDDQVKTAVSQKRTEFIGRLTEVKNGGRRLVRSLHYFNLPAEEREQAVRLVQDYRRRMPEPPTPDYYEVDDVCGRIAGIGSMGRLRYALLVHGKGSREARNVLLEFKEARPSAYDVYRQRATDAAALQGRAERVIRVQRESQAASNAYLGYALDGDKSFQVRQLGPHDSRVDTKALRKSNRLEGVSQVQAGILARTHARAAMRAVGVTNALAELVNAEAFCQRMLAFSLAYAGLVQRDWMRFVGQRAELESGQWGDK